MMNSPRSRRHILAALPAVALAAAACTSGQQTPDAAEALPAPPRPATPDDAVKLLMDGNARFAARTPEIRDTAMIDGIWGSGIDHKQEPFAIVLGCADSRLAPELLFDQFIGDIFVVREAGNIAESPTNIGSLEYGQAVLGAKALVVLGHSDCGAVKAAYTNATTGGDIQSIVTAIRPGIAGAADLGQAIVRNVGAVIDLIRGRSPVLTEAEKSRNFKIVGAVYDIGTAKVTLL